MPAGLRSLAVLTGRMPEPPAVLAALPGLDTFTGVFWALADTLSSSDSTNPFT